MGIAVFLLGAHATFASIGPVPGGSPASGSQNDPPPSPHPLRVLPAVVVATVWDDNVFSVPVPTASAILRVTPSISMRRSTTKWTITSGYQFDAERYVDHEDLTTPLARQNGEIVASIRSSTRTALALIGRFGRTQTPTDFNHTTGLTIGRQPASVTEAGSELTHLAGAHRSVNLAYRFQAYDVANAIDSRQHSVRFQASHEIGPHNKVHLAYLGEFWRWEGKPSTVSQVGLVGWSRGLTSMTELKLEAGPRVDGDGQSLRPEINLAVAHHVTTGTEVSASYAHTRTIAVGVGGAIDTDRVLAMFAYRQQRQWAVTLAGGAFRDVFAQNKVAAYQVTAEVDRAVTSTISLIASLSASLNRRRIDGFPDQVDRNVVAVGLRLRPWTER